MAAAVTNTTIIAPAVTMACEARAAYHGADTAAHDRADGTGDNRARTRANRGARPSPLIGVRGERHCGHGR
jgi:hypothetical protein